MNLPSVSDYKRALAVPLQEMDGPAKRLASQIRDRIRSGVDWCLRNASIYKAIDSAWDVPCSQVTPTLVRMAFERAKKDQNPEDVFKRLGLDTNEFFTVITQDGKPKKILNVPLFFNVMLPLVKAYTLIRVSKLFVERNSIPLLRYIPLSETDQDRITCEIVTKLTQVLSQWFGYATTLREAILQAMKYGTAIVFPREAWYNSMGKQGLRYVIPHPTKCFADLRFPLSSLNTDSGCEYAGFWEVVRYGEILRNRRLWQRHRIQVAYALDQHDFGKAYFQELYPCSLKFPQHLDEDPSSRDQAFRTYTPQTQEDAALYVVQYFARFNPAEYQLVSRSYDSEYWHRFVVGGDTTILYAEPLAYRPTWFIGYDYDPHAAVQSSLALEIMPTQDAIANALRQMMLTARQNLIEILMYDKNVLSESAITSMVNEKMYVSLNFLPYDSIKLGRAGVEAARALARVPFASKSIAEYMQLINQMLATLERTLQMGPQEFGTSASHYQSSEEIRMLGSFVGTRLGFLGSHVDDAIYAWKEQLYQALVHYMTSDVPSVALDNIDELSEWLLKIGFQVVRRSKATVVGVPNPQKLPLVAFASSANELPRQVNMAVAEAIYRVVSILVAQPALTQMVGVDVVLQMVEEAAKLSGAPPTFKIKTATGETEQQQPNLQALAQAVAELQQAMQQLAGLAASHQETAQRVQALEPIVAGLQRLAEQNVSALSKAQTQAEIARLKMELQRDLAQQKAYLQEKLAQAKLEQMKEKQQ